jgi:threonine dehydratase
LGSTAQGGTAQGGAAQGGARLPTYADVQAAARRLQGHAHRTPVMTSRGVDEALGASVYFKCENFQRIGAFKFRGAFNALSCLPAGMRSRGVIAFSSGNHAQAVALAARMLGIEATIIMPTDAPASKLAATRAYGGCVVTYDRYRENRAEIAGALARERGAPIIPPYDHPDVIAGQGTAATELLEEVGPLDSLFVCLGGGGLLAGTLLAAKALSPACRVYGVEPEAGNDGQQSLRLGSIVSIDVPKTIADGAQTQSLGKIPFELIRRDAADIFTAADSELIDCMRLFASRLKIVVEPTGCLGFAAVRSHAALLAGQRVGVIISGGNVDADRYAALLSTPVPG